MNQNTWGPGLASNVALGLVFGFMFNQVCWRGILY